VSIDINHIDDMFKGWFIGNFEPTVLNTNDVEVAVKRYKKGEYEELHFHKIATEVTVIVEGEVKIAKETYRSGSIITINPGISVDFEALTDAITVVVKYPGANNDKYLGVCDD
jgi:mannose-6-phosphate isomerase-like protein (cupin superfamily)